MQIARQFSRQSGTTRPVRILVTACGVGADDTAAPEMESAQRWAHRLTLPNLTQCVELGEEHSMVYVKAPRAFHHNTLQSLAMRSKYGVNLVAVERTVAVHTNGEASASPTRVIEVPMAETTILPTDVLILVGSNEALSRLPVD